MLEDYFQPIAAVSPAAATALQLTIHGRSGQRIIIGELVWSQQAPATGLLTVSDGAGPEISLDAIPAPFAMPISSPGLIFAPGQDVVISVPAGGAGTINRVVAMYRYEPIR